MAKPTIKNIAELAGVSTATVSYVLNNNYSKVGEQTRNRILDLISELDYKPSAIARGLNNGRSHMIGLIVPDISKSHFSVLVSGIEAAFNKANYGILICNAYNSLTKEQEYYNRLSEKNVDGIIIAAGAIHGRYEDVDFDSSLIPLVMIDRYIEGLENQYGVYSDNYHGTYLGTKYLLEQGHTKIGCITGPLESANTTERIRGYRHALEEQGVVAFEEWIYSGSHSLETGATGLESMMKSNTPTAILAGGDLLAYGVYQAARSLNISIPEELSVIGIDDNIFSELITPKLSVLRPPLYKIGTKAATMLQQLIDNKKLRKRKIVYSPELVIRESTRRLP
ncbi:substrate-binding domain-containing protein [Paenibacillus crassostreae]|uniref:HTH lacI-type domain-containing protein n=1 Tax=Paenibacillus crassostreae TaxID=1763538 RepID=A0A167BEW0_9BACL|nr:substrate-binding domain-containing protein [Paenibacillus crassostreae]AOZ92903.1 hypothetical protein LPB68_12210 [Paenibacillus crassostreae]OAB72008.1 hypothetical protein PNBC_18685 [Paenibacillus crassostreae]